MGATRGLLAIAMFLRGEVFAFENLRGSDSRAGVEQSIEQMSSPVLDADGSQMLLAEGKSISKTKFLMTEIPPQTDQMHLWSKMSSKINC